MDSFRTTETWTGTPGAIAPADGNAATAPYAVAPTQAKQGSTSSPANIDEFDDTETRRPEASATNAPTDLGLNNERLEDAKPKLVHALRGLVRQYREEGVVARRHEIRRIRQARLFWQGLQYAWWNPNDMNWHLPFEQRFSDDRALEEMPRYQFVTNFYQGFGLSFIAVLSQDVPSVRFYPQSAQSLEDISAARVASDVATLIEQNNQVEHLLTSIGYFLWTDGKLGAYVRYIADGQRFGFHEENVLEALEIPLGEDVYVCPQCGKDTPAQPQSSVILSEAKNLSSLSSQNEERSFDYTPQTARLSAQDDNHVASCANCGAELADANLRRAERVTVPRIAGTRRVPNGQEVISIAGGLELNTPVWASEMHEYPYLQWQAEVHRAKLKAAYPHAADKIETSPSQGAEDVYARVSRLSVEQGLPSIHPGDALYNLITFDRTWLRPWAFYSVEDADVRNELLALFPDGCYVAFAGEAYCESRSESMDDHWRVLHALPGDGQNRPSVGDSLVQVQERYNVLSNMQAETYEYGIPPIYADPQVLDFDALANQIAEPAAHFPARARPGQPLAAGFFQPAPAQVPPDMLRHQQDLIGPVAQFLTGLFPAVFGGNMEDVKTASGYALARDQALGRLGLVWRRLKQFYADVILLGVDVFRKNRPEDVEIPLLGPDGVLDARLIRVADLKGNICVHPEADETFPRLKSQQRGVLQQMFTINDPVIQRALTEPANLGYIKNVLGLTEMVIPGEDSRNKQLREIQQLLTSPPIVVEVPQQAHAAPDVILSRSALAREAKDLSASGTEPSPKRDSSSPSAPQNDNAYADAHGSPVATHESPVTNHDSRPLVLPSVPVDALLDDHAVEFEECKRWANSEAGQAARMTNPVGFANVRAHAEAHLRAISPAAALSSNPTSLIQAPQVAHVSRLSPLPPSSELHTTSAALPKREPREFSSRADGRDSAGDHWVTIDGNHVLMHEPQGRENQQTPQNLAAQIPCHVKAAISASIKASNSPTPDDKKGGFHEEGGQWIITADGQTIVVPAKPGPANPKVEGGAHMDPSDAVDPHLKDKLIGLGGTWHVHPSGTLLDKGVEKHFTQPPSERDKKEAGFGANLVIAARENKVYFYNNSGIIKQPIKLRDFLKGC